MPDGPELRRSDDLNNNQTRRETNPQNIREAARDWSPEKQERFNRADDFYREAGYENYDSHLRGIDFDQPVEVVDIERGTNLYQYSYISETTGEPKTGSYFYDNPEINPNNLGFDIKDRQMIRVELDQSSQFLRSTSANIEDWEGSGNIFSGGETQLFNPNTQLINIGAAK